MAYPCADRRRFDWGMQNLIFSLMVYEMVNGKR